MKFKILLKTLFINLLCFFLSGVVSGQNFSFKNYGVEYGIPNSFIYSINQSDNGFLWVGTGNGLARFDGYQYYMVTYPDSIESRNAAVSFKDKNGTLWFGCSDGTVFYYSGNNLEQLRLSNTRSISEILQGPDNLVYIIPQGKSIFSVDPAKPENIRKHSIPEEYVMFSGAFTDAGLLLIGAQGSILECNLSQGDSSSVMRVIEGFKYSGVTSINKTGIDSFIIGTEDNGLFQLMLSEDHSTLARFNNHPEWSSLNVQSIFIDSEKKIWISTFGSGVIQFRIDEQKNADLLHVYNTSTGLASDDVKLVFQDSEGNYWFGLFGNTNGAGISMLGSYAFRYYIPGRNSLENNILFVNSYGKDYILGTPSGFHLFNQDFNKSASFTNLTARTGGSLILSYFLDDQQKLWIGTDGKGLFVRNPDGIVRLFYRSGDTGSDQINDIQVDETSIWLATTNGVIILDKNSARRREIISTDDGLPHNSINKIILSKGNAYIGTLSDRLYRIDSIFTLTPSGCVMTGSTMNKILALAKDSNGGIWAATNGNGIFSCHNDSLSILNRSNGLYSNYCYSILADSENNLWIGHAKGFSKFDHSTEMIKTYGPDYARGGTCNPGAMFESADKKIFIGTTEGIIIYDLKKDNIKEIPPYNNITSIIINDKEYNYQPVIKLPYFKYRITVKYSGVNFSDPEKVFYQSYLENFDTEPGKMSTAREVSYMLSDGKYKFNLLSVDENGLSRMPLVSFMIIIDKPVYKKWWFILLIVLSVTGLIVVIIREREKSQKKIRNYLEEELDKRTSVIIKQKSEIEIQNLEITDSINYAKRIQSSILPDINKLRENFTDAFIMFHPRDIVSGDFYWFDKIDDQKFILACADSTGHGVPGAFMSMIGSTLLQDIVTRKKISSPSQILGLLDKQIFSTLNQNVDLGVSNDGMDMVVCEFNIKTRHLRFASAMRPIILVMSGESHYIKGDRSSVGGESVIEKYFVDQEYYLSEGDTLYLFSDGIPDQFGGVEGKKMKIARLKKIIDQVSRLPMRDQEKAMSDYFNEWKGSYDQVDDVLMIGVRL